MCAAQCGCVAKGLGIMTMSAKSVLTIWNDECGSVYSMEIILCTLVLVFGLLAGFTAYRNAVAQELGDISVALDEIDQSFNYDLVVAGGGTVTRQFVDATTLTDPVGAPPAGLSLTTAAVPE